VTLAHLRSGDDRGVDVDPAQAAGAPGERITWLGHATLLLEVGGARLLTDPLLRDRVGHLRRHAVPPPAALSEDIDAVLVSHLHLDHLDVGSLRRLSRRVPVLAPAGGGALLRRLGFANTVELPVGDEAQIGGAQVRAVPAVHDGRRHPLAPLAEAIGFVVAGAHRVYFAGDTDIFDDMAQSTGPLDVALLPVWGWGPSLGPGHMDPLGAARAAALLRPRIAVPIHWGTFFPIGLARSRGDVLVDPPLDFARHAAELAPGVEVRILAPGETLALDARAPARGAEAATASVPGAAGGHHPRG
jgi:L-ascorbate metabolism protein UlaG (beta-lactamase superfamily)